MKKPSIEGLGIVGLGSSSLIGQMGYQLQMGRVATQSLVAQMIDLLLARHVAEVVGVSHDMGGYGLPVQAHSPVISPTAIT